MRSSTWKGCGAAVGRSRTLSTLVFLSVLQNCAQVEVKRVTATVDQPGIRYWRPAPYLALQPSVTGTIITCEAKLVMLPDKSEEYAITMSSGFGTVEASPSLQDGWNLTAMTGKADSKTVETLTALASVIKGLPLPLGTAVTSGGQARKTFETNCSGLYRLRYGPNGQLEGLDRIPLPIQTVSITTSPSAVPSQKCGQPGQPACPR